MQEWILPYLQCPRSGAPLALAGDARREGDHILAGTLVSTRDPACRYPIVDGVPDFIGDMERGARAATLDTFGTEWSSFSGWGWIDQAPDDKDAELQVRSGLSSDSEKDFLMKTGLLAAGETKPRLGALVLDAGCGNGRFSREAARYADRVISVDASAAAFVAHENFRRKGIGNACAIRASVLSLPIRDGVVDYTFSIGVLQHTGDGPGQLREMSRILKPGARLSLNCYGTGSAVYEAVDTFIRRRTTVMSEDGKRRFARRLAAANRFVLKAGAVGRKVDRYWRRVMCIRPTYVQMYDWYSPAIADHYSPDQLLAMFRQLDLKILAGSHRIDLPDYDDRRRRRGASSYCFLLARS
ncbi:MAG: methyltransferase domain-containing protein [Alphaproteobacteria bacterium]|nr:methyltransferase domain-containing protein [Alphaproteobacteria bacterium]